MPATDFINALGRLLRDGALRDALATNPYAVAAHLKLRDGDAAALAQLIPAELEFQAGVLIRKRLDLVCRILPETCRRLGAETWPVYLAYARTCWPKREQSATHDAHGFCRHLQQHQPDCLCPAEVNRLRFAVSSKRFALHIIRRRPPPPRTQPILQLFFRLDQQGWRETTVSFRL